jgi:hypothetical protein
MPQVPLSVLQSSQAALLQALTALNTQEKGVAEENRPKYEPWYAPSVLVQFLLFIVGCGYTYYAWKQWGAIRVQSDIARDAADAARDSAKAADAARHVYRPFLVVDQPPKVGYSRNGPLIDLIPVNFSFQIHNYGIGPADLLRINAEAQIFAWNGKDEPNPQYAVEDSFRLIESVIGAEQKSLPLEPRWFDITREEFQDMRVGTMRLSIHGIVYYRGGPEKVYWTRFFWWYLIDSAARDVEIVRANRPEVNAHT